MGDEKTRLRFLREEQTASMLEHPNIVRIYKLIDEADHIAIAMEYFPDGDLRRWAKEHAPLGAADILRVLRQVASALDFAHSRGVLHRDVKPGNILIDPAGNAHLGDFGLVRLPDAPHLTQVGSMVGTATYTSPEQAQGKPDIDGRADQYSLAVVAFELLAGKPPFEGENSTAISLLTITQPPPVPSSLNPAVPAELDEVLLRALAKAPAERYPSCSEFVHALETAQDASLVRRFRGLLAEARTRLGESKYTEAHQCLMAARTLLPDRPEMQTLLAELEQERKTAEGYEACAKAWQSARQKAQSVLDLYPSYPDPQGIFIEMGLRHLPRRMPTLAELLRQTWPGLVVGLLVAGAFILGAFLIIAG
jgi:serine/threonine protein kinase